MRKKTANNILIFSLFLMLVILLVSCHNLRMTNDFLTEELVSCLDEISDLNGQIKQDPDVTLFVCSDFALNPSTKLER